MPKTSAEEKLELLLKQVPYDREEILRHMLGYGETDLLCYRASGALQQRQDELFDPILAWAYKAHRLDFRVTNEVTPVEQPAESLAKLRTIFVQANDRELAALSLLTSLLGSVLLALAVWKKQVTVEEAIAASHLDEAFQAEMWGTDEEAAAAWTLRQKDIRTAAVFLDS